MMASPSPNTRGGLGIATPRRILLRMYKCANPAPFRGRHPRAGGMMQNQDLIRTLATGLEAGEQIERLSELVEVLTDLLREVGSGEPIAYDARGLADVLPISKQVIDGLMAAGVFPTTNIGRRKVVLREDVIETLREMQRVEREQYMNPGERHFSWAHSLAAILQARRERPTT